MEASTVALADESVDVVISNHALEHTLRPWDELRDLRRVLRPRGRLISWVPLDDWRGQRGGHATDPNHHLYAWTPLLLRNLVTEAGFAVRDTGVCSRAWPPRGLDLLSRLPAAWFDVACAIVSRVLRRRQVFVVAERSG
jgi:SAM-dependent methyltransferase